MRRGNLHLNSVLVEAAWGGLRKRDSYLKVQYHRIAARRGKKYAIIAVAHTLLVIIYNLLKRGTIYKELGKDYFDKMRLEGLKRYHVED